MKDSAGRPVSEAGTVLIFRKRLLPWSETFVAAQGRALQRYRPVFTGYSAEAGGLGYLAGCERILLSRHGFVPGLGKALLKLTGRVPRGYLRALERTDPRLIHAHFGTSIPPASAIARDLGIPLLVTFHGHDIATVPRSPEAAQRRADNMARIDHAIAVSDFIAQRVLDAGCPPNRLTVHRIGVDTDLFTPTRGAPTGAAQRQAEAGKGGHAQRVHDTNRVLFVGRLVAKKGLIHLLNAFPAIQARVPTAQLIVAGDGPLRAEMEQRAARLNVNAEFTGVQTPAQILDRMRGAALLAAPSVVTASGDAEGLPITIMEAIACGLPVVASPSGGSAEGVRHGETGFVVPPGDEESLAAAIGDLLEDATLRGRMGAAARAFALEAFSLQRQTLLLEQIYDRVIREYGVRRV